MAFQNSFRARPGLAPVSEGSEGANSRLLALLIVIFFMGFHSDLNLYSGSQIIVPTWMSLLATGLILVFFPGFLNIRMFSWIALIGAAALVSSFINSGLEGNLLQRLRSCLQFSAAITSGCVLYRALVTLGIRRANSLFFWSLIVLIIGSAVEIYGGLKPVFDAIRAVMYGGRSVYDQSVRDVLVYGAIRPTLFSPEPSYVGISISLALTGWFLTAGHIKLLLRVLFLFLAALSAFYIVRSGTLVVGVGASLLGYLAVPTGGPRQGRRKLYMAGVVIIALAFGLLLVLALTWNSLERNAGVASYARSGSFFIRIIGPPIVAISQMNKAPLLGTGLGGDDTIASDVFNLYALEGVFYKFPYLRNANIHDLLTNNFWWHWIYFGAGMGLVMIWLLARMLRELRVPSPSYVFLATAIFWLTYGGYVTVRSWAVFFILAALIALATTSVDRRQVGGRQTAARAI